MRCAARPGRRTGAIAVAAVVGFLVVVPGVAAPERAVAQRGVDPSTTTTDLGESARQRAWTALRDARAAAGLTTPPLPAGALAGPPPAAPPPPVPSGRAGYRAAADFADPAGDTSRTTVDPATGQITSTPEQRAEADLLSHGATYGATELELRATVAAPPGDGAVAADFFLDSDGDPSVPEAVASVLVLGGEVLGGAVGAAGTGIFVCEGTATLDGRELRLAELARGCAGGGAQLRVGTQVAYQTPDDEVFSDVTGAGSLGDPDADGPIAGEAVTLPRATDRLAGPDRLTTAVRIVGRAVPAPPVSEVVLATASNFPDALASGAGFAPVLLVPPCGPLPDVVGRELSRLAPARVTALGGPAAVCDDLLSAAAAAAGPGSTAGRRAGPDRFTTAVAISQATYTVDPATGAGQLGRLHLANAGNYPDALAGGTLPLPGPILLVPDCGSVPAPVLDEVRRLAPSEVVVLGGPAAVCDAVADEVRSAAQAAVDASPATPQDATLPVTLLRLAGQDRIGTAVALSQFGYPQGAIVVYLTVPSNYPDALAGGILRRGPILLVPSCGPVPRAVLDEIARLNPTRVIALGGEQAIPAATLANAAAQSDADGAPCGQTTPPPPPSPPPPPPGGPPSSVDPTDDANDVFSQAQGEVIAFPRADIRTWGVTATGARFETRMRVAEPTDPSDPAVFLGWSFDVDGDGEEDVDLQYFGTPEPYAELVRTDDGSLICVADAAYVDGAYLAGVNASCLGDPAQVGVYAFTIYGTSPDDLYFDDAPSTGFIQVARP